MTYKYSDNKYYFVIAYNVYEQVIDGNSLNYLNLFYYKIIKEDE